MPGKHRIICKICNSIFCAGVPFAKYCSKKCKRRATYLFGNEYISHPRKLTYINCSYCGAKVRKEPSNLRYSKSGKLYCNKSCKAKAEMPKEKIIIFCEICHKKIERLPSTIKKHNFCSRKCCNIWKRQFIGENTPNWKGGYNKSERERIRARIFWKELRKEILALFKNKCVDCKNDEKLHIHHVFPYRLGGKDSINNLIPLCPVCHSKQTVKDWEDEHRLSWKECGAHISRGGDVNVGENVWN